MLGRDVVKDARWVRERVGYVFGGERGLYERLSGLDNLRYFAELYAVDPRRQRARIHELLDLVGLKGREQERVEGYSRGMRQRLHIARGLLHDPPVLFLDEPTIGIDPVGARELRALIASLTQAGKTVLLTTHYMFEADSLCDRIAVIAKGEIVAQGTPQELKAAVEAGSVVEVEVFGIDESRSSGCGRSTASARRSSRSTSRTASDRPDRARSRADARDPLPAERHRRRPGLVAGADARGRLHPARDRRVTRLARVVGLGLVIHVKHLSRNAFDVMATTIWPLVYATLAYFMFRAGSRPETSSCSASLGATVMGIWSITTVGAADAIQRQRWAGVLELLVAAPTPFWAVLLPITIATSTIGIYALVSTLLWGRLLFGIPLELEQPLLFALSIPPTIVSIGLLGFVMASVVVRFRAGWAVGNMFEYPVWLVTGLLIPVAILPYWAEPISWLLAPTWGMKALTRLGRHRRLAALRHRHVPPAQRRVRGDRRGAARALPPVGAPPRDAVFDMRALT